MTKPHFMRIDRQLLKELKEIKEKNRKQSLSDVVREMMNKSEKGKK